MKKHAKVVSVVLAAMLLLSLASGCGTQKTSQKTGSTAKPYQVVMAFPSPASIPGDWQAVQNAVSKMTLQKINASVKLMAIPSGSWMDHATLMLSGGQKLDLLYVSPQYNFMGQVAEGSLQPLGSLLDKYGAGIKKTVAPGFLKAGMVGGKLYAIPCFQNYATQNAIVMQDSMIKKYHIDVNKIKSPTDLTAVFQTIKAHDPTVIPLVQNFPGVQNTVLKGLAWYDPLGDSLGVLPNYNNGLKVVDLYETAKYAQMLHLIRQWYLKGYIQTNAATTTEPGMDFLKAGKAFASLVPYIPDGGKLNSMIMGRPMVLQPISKTAVVTTKNVAANMYAIPTGSKNPEKAMEFLNLLYTDSTLLNTIDHGIAGKDYIKKSANVFQVPSGVSPQNAYPSWSFLFGNGYLSWNPPMIPSDMNQKALAFTDTALKSKALGFEFDASSVKTQYAAVTNVVDQYAPGLEDGSSDPATVLPKFIASLKAAGIDKIIAAKQKQLDAWAKANQ